MTEEDVTEDSGTSGISRRSLIKAGAVVGGAVWVAPVIDSFVTKSAAQSLQSVCGIQFVCGDTATCGPAGAGCLCTLTTDGDLFCSNNFTCDTVPTCTTTADCPPGWRCQAAGTGCCGAGVCLPPCGIDPPIGIHSNEAGAVRTNRG